MTSTADALVLKFVDLINAHDSARLVALCSDDHVFFDSLGHSLSGRAPLQQGWEAYFGIFPDYRIELQTTVADGDLVLGYGFASATHAASGTAWRIPAAWRARVKGQHIAEWQVYADNKPVYELFK